ncbi:hypothetical protein [Deinococcus radiopugnans]|uniref:Uncharacterized protein n=1 Tax=Deinococcus radiopugnans ATCC 19172 TaxID=585398 RepID=A0A5C4Y7A7_9DEIO|nr:hypothetical protein [Deinococcus radiopugnans]MBB6015137.1 hypothetical protein [Deinococcus radiopugnans ATCC 19172]TNM70905.1 hypothetical protein FHR04_10465 [Deinococcus radiopugnans ATCC 19172]
MQRLSKCAQMPDFEARPQSLPTQRAGLALGLWGEAEIGKTHTAEEWLRDVPCRTAAVRADAPLVRPGRALPSPHSSRCGPSSP